MDGGRDDSFALWVATLYCIFHRYHNIKIPSQTTLVFIISIVTGPSQTTLVFIVSIVTGPSQTTLVFLVSKVTGPVKQL